MRVLITTIVILVASTSYAEVPTQANFLFNTGPFPCNGSVINLEWTNASGKIMRIHGARSWHGRDYGAIADFHSEVRLGNGSVVAMFQQDAYGNDGHREQETWYGGYQTLNPGETLHFFAVCNAPATGGNGHVTVLFFWQEVQ